MSLKSLVSMRLKGMNFQVLLQKKKVFLQGLFVSNAKCIPAKVYLENQNPNHGLHFPSIYFNLQHSNF